MIFDWNSSRILDFDSLQLCENGQGGFDFNQEALDAFTELMMSNLANIGIEIQPPDQFIVMQLWYSTHVRAGRGRNPIADTYLADALNGNIEGLLI